MTDASSSSAPSSSGSGAVGLLASNVSVASRVDTSDTVNYDARAISLQVVQYTVVSNSLVTGNSIVKVSPSTSPRFRSSFGPLFRSAVVTAARAELACAPESGYCFYLAFGPADLPKASWDPIADLPFSQFQYSTPNSAPVLNMAVTDAMPYGREMLAGTVKVVTPKATVDLAGDGKKLVAVNFDPVRAYYNAGPIPICCIAGARGTNSADVLARLKVWWTIQFRVTGVAALAY